jgi:hypothetical protein
MATIPQLRKDIETLQSQLRAANDRIRELESRKPQVITREVEVPVRVIKTVEVPVDRIVQVPVEVPVERVVTRVVTQEVPVDRIVEKIVEVPVRVIRVVEKEVPGPEVIKTVEVPVIQYVDNPDLIETINKLRARLNADNPE